MKVSVIIPIYKVSRFIERCAVSLMKQTLDSVEFIFVNDATPDNSMDLLYDVLERFPDKAVRIIEHEYNKGLPAARNSGLAIATGEYVYHCDSDDFMESDMLEILYGTAKEHDVDYIWCDWFLCYENKERYMKQPSCVTSTDALKAMLNGSMKYNVWNKLVKRALYVENNILFPNGHSMGEDMTMIRIVACAQKVAYVGKALYHYVRSNSDAMTQSLKEHQLVDIYHNVEETLAFLSLKGVNMEKELAYFKLNVKLPFLISGQWGNYTRWNEWYPEANKYINNNKTVPLRTRMLQQMAAHKIYIGVWVYYIIVYRILYRLLYN